MQIDQHGAVQCKCIDGFELNINNTLCVRTIYPPTATPIGVSHEVNTTFGKLRLVSQEGPMCVDNMSGRIELQVDNVFDRPEWINIFQSNVTSEMVNITEPRENQWFTLRDAGFDINAANYTCRTMFGPLAEVVSVVHGSQCGKSESRVWGFDCPLNATVDVQGQNFPQGCYPNGPYAGCTDPGCEFAGFLKGHLFKNFYSSSRRISSQLIHLINPIQRIVSNFYHHEKLCTYLGFG